MQEFTSISVSSYEAGALADRLTEQAREGWGVVAIVPTGSSITAYLSRAASGAEGPTSTTPEPAAVTGAEPAAAPTDEPAEAPADEATPETVEPTTEDAPTATEVAPEMPAAEPAGVDTGWAVTPEPAATPAGGVADDDIAALAAQLGADSTTTETPAEPAVTAPAETATAAAAPAAAPAAQAAAASAAPAGWYADPSSRFELRYWDGTQWTEHVSRAGQQYTDPPVA